ncbi:MAG: N-acetylmuramoyl-L-alanine amidase, partial [Planctomycetes bacterium]|nr:N-acetylmuramoyl-L-alanine amidase [Planctomycetota bacterium]
MRIDLQMSAAEGSLLFSMAEVEAIVEYLTAAIDPQRDLAGVVVRYRADEADPYRLLESLVPVSEPGIYEDPRDVAADGDLAFPPSARSGAGSMVDSQPTGALTGVVVYVSAGHGWTSGSSTWGVQRPLLFNMIEDYGNLEQLNYFVNYCFNAGATVVPFRPVGYQTEEIVLDQDDPEVTYAGAWTDSTGSPYYENNRTVSGVSYRFSSISPVETATARYTPDIAVADFYPVYTWALNRPNRSLQKYRITHSGGASEVHVDHRMVGKGWVFLGHYYFEAGTEGYVEVSNESSDGGVVVADAIRFGNGIGDMIGAAPGTVSGYPRDEEASRYWAESETDINAVGLPRSIYDCCSSDQSDNVGTPARWAREMNITGFNNDRWRRVYLEFHSNASSNGSARGTVALITGNATTNQALYADIMGEEIEEDMHILEAVVPFEYPWGSRANTFTGSFGAISTTNNGNEFDATILEVAFHDNLQDTRLLRDSKVRDAVARSSVHGIIKFLNALGGSQIPLAFAPDKPRQVQAAHDDAGGVIVSWLAPLSGEAFGDSAIGYRVYRSANGFGFDEGLDVGNVLSTTLTDVPADAATYIHVTAYNDGGASMPSETLAVRRSADKTPTFLIVNGFDRVGRTQNLRQFIPGLGTQRRPILRHVNSSDYAVQLGEALAAAGATFDSCANEAVINGTVVLADYPGVAWICGEESSADSTFNATEQALAMDFLNGGGNLFVSGAEIGWDLDNLNNGRSFYNNYLKAAYSADDADTYDVTPIGGSIFAGISPFSFDDGTLFYDSEFPDVLINSGGSAPALAYVGGTGGVAAVVFDGGF